MAAKVSVGKSASQGEAEATESPSPQAQPQRAANGVQYVTDSTGRKIGVRPLDALTRFRIRRIAGPDDARNFAAMIDYFTAAVVAELDGMPQPPIRTLREVEAMISQLAVAGMDAVGSFVLNEIGLTPEALEEAKNSQATPS